MTNELVSKNFVIPLPLRTNTFRLEILAPDVFELDYEAIMSCRKRLNTVFGMKTEWPKTSLSIEDNLEDLVMHQSEFKTRKAFAYSILSTSRDKALGTLYIDPSRVSKFDCEVQFWIRDDSVELENEIYESISKWIELYWQFNKTIYPGRNISWKEWNLLLEQSGYEYTEDLNLKRRLEASLSS